MRQGPITTEFLISGKKKIVVVTEKWANWEEVWEGLCEYDEFEEEVIHTRDA